MIGFFKVEAEIFDTEFKIGPILILIRSLVEITGIKKGFEI